MNDSSVYLLEWDTVYTADGGPITIPGGAAYHVATNGNDSWGGLLGAPNGGGTDGPFATLDKARAMMRTTNIKRVLIHAGYYRLSAEFALTSADNGCTYEAFPGDTVVIHGADQQGSFTSEGANIYSATLASPVDLELFVGFERYRVAQSGNWNPADPYKSGWYTCDRDGTQAIIRYTTSTSVAADLALATMTGSSSRVRVQALDRERLADTIQTVSSFNTTNREITMGGSGQYTLRAGSTFRFLNRSEWINGDKQFGHRHSDGKVVIRTTDSAFTAKGVYIPRLSRLVSMTGCTDVKFIGITFAYTVWYGQAFAILGATTGCTVRACKFIGTGGMIITGSTNNIVEFCEFDQCGRNALEMTGGANGNAIRSNTISNVGQVRLEALGIGGNQLSDNVIENNTITNSSRYGISIKNWATFNINLNNVVRWNKVINTCTQTADGGAIEMLGRSGANTNTKIYGNYIEKVYGLATSSAGAWLGPYKGFGIYLDDQTGGVEMTDNFVTECSWAAIYIHGGDNNTARNNFCIMESDSWKALRIENVPQEPTLGIPQNNLFELNLIYAKTSVTSYQTLFTPGTFTIRNNLVYNAPAYSGSNDLVANPLFVDISSGDYRLQATSPAFNKGIHDLAWSKMGVTGLPPVGAVNTLLYKTLRASNYTYNHPSAPGPYPARFVGGISYRREISRGGNNYGTAQMSWGEAALINNDGFYNWLYVLNAATDGRKATVKVGATADSHYLTFKTMFVGQVEQFWMSDELIRLRWRDRLAEIIDKPIQQYRFLGNNVPPSGVEGGEALEGRCKPVLYATARNLEPVLVNEQRPIYQVSDMSVVVSKARDGGVPLTDQGLYSLLTDMYDNAQIPSVGAFKYYRGNEGTFVRLQNFPRQGLRVDAEEGLTDAYRTPARLFRRILVERAGVLETEIDLADLELLNNVNTSVMSGLWFGDTEVTIQEALDRIAVSIGGWYGIKNNGLWTLQRIEDPDTQDSILRLHPYTLGTAAIAATDSNILSFAWLEDSSDQRGVPILYAKAAYDPNMGPQIDSDLGGDKTSATDVVRSPISTTAGPHNREWLKNEWRYTTADDGQSGSTVTLKHPTAKPWNLVCWYRDRSAANTEALRQYGLRSRIPRAAEIKLPITSKTAILDLGRVVEVKYPQYGLSEFTKFLITSIDYNSDNNVITIVVRR